MITQEVHKPVRTALHGKQWPALLIALIIPFTVVTIGNIATNRSLFVWYRWLRNKITVRLNYTLLRQKS